MLSLDARFAPYAALLCIVVFAYLTLRHPTGLALSAGCAHGIAWVQFLGMINFAKLLVVMQGLAIIWLIFKLFSSERKEDLFRFLQSRSSIPGWFLVILWIKITADLCFGGMNEFRLEAIKLCLSLVIFPAILMLLGIACEGREKSIRSFVMGMILFGGAVLVPVSIPIWVEGRVAGALFGGERLTIYGLDTISSGQFFLVAAMGMLGFALLNQKRKLLAQLAFAGIMSLFGLLYLNGTRQYILALVVAFGLSLSVFLKHVHKGTVFIAILVLGGGGLVGWGYLARAATSDRFTVAAFESEMTESRGEIWSAAITAGIRAPLLGEGFRRFGVIDARYNPNSGTNEYGLDGAHGFLQEIIAEHGLLFGSTAICVFLFSVVWMVRRSRTSRRLDLSVAGILCFTLFPTCLFSGTVYDNDAPYLIAAGMMFFSARDDKRLFGAVSVCYEDQRPVIDSI